MTEFYVNLKDQTQHVFRADNKIDAIRYASDLFGVHQIIEIINSETGEKTVWDLVKNT